MNLRIIGYGYAYPGDGLVPGTIVTNEMIATARGGTDEEIAARVEKIVKQTGVRQRPYLDPDWTTNQMAAAAGKRALAHANLDPSEIGAVVLATMTPVAQSPQGYGLATELGLGLVPVITLESACSGFIYGLQVASALLISKTYQRILVIGADAMSRVIDPDSDSALIFGDGAGAMILELGKQEFGAPILLTTKIGGDDRGRDKIKIPTGGPHFLMDGRAVYRWAITDLANQLKNFLEENGGNTIEHVVPHQANVNILENLAQKTGIPWDRWVVTLDSKANCSAGSIPLAFALRAPGWFRSGNNILLAGFGGGLSWGFALIRWL